MRFSSMGDVAMTVPVIKQVLKQNPTLQVTVVSNALYQPLFENLQRCTFYAASFKAQHKGLAGLFHLYKDLNKSASFDGIVDLHGVLRSYVLSGLFKFFKRINISVIDKGRSEKKALTKKTGKIFYQLTSMHERYAQVFRESGVLVLLNDKEPVLEKMPLPQSLQTIFHSGKKIIGLAPFAKHPEKMYPIGRMKLLIERLTKAGYFILLFGGGENETAILKQWSQENSFVFNIAGQYSFKEELAILSNVDGLVSMDSANMHLASLFNVRVVSIWGATHPFAGFYGWGQEPGSIVQIGLYCRPCSVYGNKPCYRGDHACMNRIDEEVIFNKIRLL